MGRPSPELANKGSLLELPLSRRTLLIGAGVLVARAAIAPTEMAAQAIKLPRPEVVKAPEQKLARLIEAWETPRFQEQYQKTKASFDNFGIELDIATDFLGITFFIEVEEFLNQCKSEGPSNWATNEDKAKKIDLLHYYFEGLLIADEDDRYEHYLSKRQRIMTEKREWRDELLGQKIPYFSSSISQETRHLISTYVQEFDRKIPGIAIQGRRFFHLQDETRPNRWWSAWLSEGGIEVPDMPVGSFLEEYRDQSIGHELQHLGPVEWMRIQSDENTPILDQLLDFDEPERLLAFDPVMVLKADEQINKVFAQLVEESNQIPYMAAQEYDDFGVNSKLLNEEFMAEHRYLYPFELREQIRQMAANELGRQQLLAGAQSQALEKLGVDTWISTVTNLFNDAGIIKAIRSAGSDALSDPWVQKILRVCHSDMRHYFLDIAPSYRAVSEGDDEPLERRYFTSPEFHNQNYGLRAAVSGEDLNPNTLAAKNIGLIYLQLYLPENDPRLDNKLGIVADAAEIYEVVEQEFKDIFFPGEAVELKGGMWKTEAALQEMLNNESTPLLTSRRWQISEDDSKQRYKDGLREIYQDWLQKVRNWRKNQPEIDSEVWNRIELWRDVVGSIDSMYFHHLYVPEFSHERVRAMVDLIEGSTINNQHGEDTATERLVTLKARVQTVDRLNARLPESLRKVNYFVLREQLETLLPLLVAYDPETNIFDYNQFEAVMSIMPEERDYQLQSSHTHVEFTNEKTDFNALTVKELEMLEQRFPQPVVENLDKTMTLAELTGKDDPLRGLSRLQPVFEQAFVQFSDIDKGNVHPPEERFLNALTSLKEAYDFLLANKEKIDEPHGLTHIFNHAIRMAIFYGMYPAGWGRYYFPDHQNSTRKNLIVYGEYARVMFE